MSEVENKYWLNGSGCPDPTATSCIKSITKTEKAREKEIHDTVNQIKNILKNKNLELVDRIKIKDKNNNRKYL